jgi:hypothetical protein
VAAMMIGAIRRMMVTIRNWPVFRDVFISSFFIYILACKYLKYLSYGTLAKLYGEKPHVLPPKDAKVLIYFLWTTIRGRNASWPAKITISDL